MNKNDFEKWQSLFCQKATPLQKLNSHRGVEIAVKRDELNHSIVQGNKLRKLKYNIKFALENGFQSLYTFGGAFSNHIIATAKAAQLCGLKSLGFIRGDELENHQEKWSDTLIKAQSYGMTLHFLNRQDYRKKQKANKVKTVLSSLSTPPFLIPEGGSTDLAIVGVSEIIEELSHQINQPNYIISACGTGGTLAGLIDGVAKHGWKTKVVGIPVLKGANFMFAEIEKLSQFHQQVNWQLYLNYHAGGYAKTTAQVQAFSQQFTHINAIELDKIYTSKSFFAVYDLIESGAIKPKSSVVILHTGGLQGN